MRRSIRFRLLAVVLCFVLLPAMTAFAQDTNGPATIITFMSSLPAVSLAEIEAGEATTTLSWHVVGLDENQRLVLERYELNTFVSLLNESEVSLSPSDSREITIAPPSGFAPPTYRLAILDFRNRIIDQRIVVIPYVMPVGAEVSIDAFTTEMEAVNALALADGSARISVSWAISNRPPTANPVFEQVLPDGEAVLVELPREFLWVPSSGTGVVAPVAVDGAESIELRLRVVDMVDNSVYAEQTLTLPVQSDGETSPAAETTEESSRAEIVSFTADPTTIAIGETVQLSWEVRNASSVQISVRTSDSPQQQVIAGNLPLRAGLAIPVGEDTFSGVDSLTFIIRAMDAEGRSLATGRADVDVQ